MYRFELLQLTKEEERNIINLTQLRVSMEFAMTAIPILHKDSPRQYHFLPADVEETGNKMLNVLTTCNVHHCACVFGSMI